jgi:hypothetical protein
MPGANDVYYDRGAALGDSYIKGIRERDAAKDRELNLRRKTGELDDVEYERKRRREMDAERDGSAPPVSGGIPQPGAQPIGSRDMAPPQGATPPFAPPGTNGAPAQQAPMSTRGDQMRMLARQAYRSGNGAEFAKFDAAAKEADYQDAFNQGAMNANLDDIANKANAEPNSGMVIHKVTGPDGKPAGYEVIVIDPAGGTTKMQATPDQLRMIAGHRAAMQVDPGKALREIGLIDANLATLWKTKMDQVIESYKARNTAQHYANTDAAQMKNADANMARATREHASEGRLARLEKRDGEQAEIAAKAAGNRAGFERARALGKEGKAAADIYSEEYKADTVRAAGKGIKLDKLNEKPAVDPAAYSLTIQRLTNAGMTPQQAQMKADELHGLTAGGDADLVEALKQLQGGTKKPKPPARAASGVVTNERTK